MLMGAFAWKLGMSMLKSSVLDIVIPDLSILQYV